MINAYSHSDLCDMHIVHAVVLSVCTYHCILFHSLHACCLIGCAADLAVWWQCWMGSLLEGWSCISSSHALWFRQAEWKNSCHTYCNCCRLLFYNCFLCLFIITVWCQLHLNDGIICITGSCLYVTDQFVWFHFFELNKTNNNFLTRVMMAT